MKLKRSLTFVSLFLFTALIAVAGFWGGNWLFNKMQSDDRTAQQRIIDSIERTVFADLDIFVAPLDNVEEDACPMIQQAIDDCAARGGGHVNIRIGRYRLNGPIELRSNVDLHLEMGAYLQFSGHAADFLPAIYTRWEGTECYNYSSMILARNCENVAITGFGTIDAQACVEMAYWSRVGDDIEDQDGSKLHKMAEIGVPVDQRVKAPEAHLRPSMVQFIECNRVLVQDIRLVESPFWVLHPLYCSNVVISNVIVESFYPNNDGVVAESSSNVLIDRCLFHTGDDSVGIKSGRNSEGRAIGRPAKDIVIRSCLFSSQANGLCIGSEVSGGIENIYMDDVRIENVKNAIYFKSNSDRGGYIRNIWANNINVTHASMAVLRIETDFFDYTGGKNPTMFEDIHLSNIKSHLADYYGIYIDGQDSNPVKGVDIQNFYSDRVKIPYYVYSSENVTFKSVVFDDYELPEVPVLATEHQFFEK